MSSFVWAPRSVAIQCDNGRVRGVTTASGEFIEADAVVSNRNGVGTYLELVPDAVPARAVAGWRAFLSNRRVFAPTWLYAAGARRRTCASACQATASCAVCWSRRQR